jgi:HSP20 family protein
MYELEELMSLYTTPFTRMRRRMWERPYQEESWTEPECDVFVPVNVKAGTDEYVISALLPGVKAEDLSIQVVNETVTLQGTIKDASEEKENYLVRECPTGRFYRIIRLSEPLDSGKASADLTDGLLTLHVPKAEEARPRTIKVQAK